MPIKEIKDIEAQLDNLLKDAEREPVRIQKDGIDVGFVLSPEHFRALTRSSYKI